MKKNYSVFVLAFFFSLSIHCQNISGKSIAGVSFTNSSGNLKMDSVLADILSNASEDTQILDGFNNGLLYISSVDNSELLTDIIVFPQNNSSDTINVSISEKYKYLDLRIYDAEGAMVLNKRKAAGLNPINISKLNAGTYYLQILNPLNNEHKMYGILKK